MQIKHVKPVFVSPSISSVFDQMFQRVLSDASGMDYSFAVPSVNIVETDDKFELRMAAPGFEKQDFQISVDKDQLIIAVDKETSQEPAVEEKWIRREFRVQSFKRTFHLDKQIDTDHISAVYAQGMLNVSLPRKEDSKNKAVKLIEIQ